MSDLAALLDKEASAEIAAISSEAQERASELSAAAQAEADAQTAARERAATQQAEAALVRARSSAQLEAASIRLNAQHAAVQSVFDAARAELDRLVGQPDWPDRLGRLLEEAVAGSGLPASEVRKITVGPDDVAAARSAAEAQGLSAEVEADESVSHGVRISVGASELKIENTLLERLRSVRDDMAAEVARLLSGTAGA
ncbi:MAG TPA: V-type ATP synthase subunit E [Deinococcales bacterium]|nr:V-type ATP synthase subunit E [Deinococcales bacterium]